MIFYVYLLISKKNNRYFTYVGYTKDLKKRLLLHNSNKGAKYTKGKNEEQPRAQKVITEMPLSNF